MDDQPEIPQSIDLEAIEDAGLMAAIQEGEASELVDRAEIDAILQGSG
jgi:hypothetical protein